ncbi:VP1054 [Buzura suppressaria nucleopolyhedrovirus]|uniref:VP1054 n=1 Tax=Buzura suppressaria nuclear polyhedrosis virus TaxID=74320 RepID=W5VKE8_NPVBS|nr:VP1054 [Buzura suppressaria nucleopolyhedrovirus]AHH82631.1 VP1054 [Buzura suppressaria nucleopolyhedrovirus]AKN91014.1 VP1054 [Buzura suppressaria nucleopolyhedrovirus]QYF10610.1 capsid protein [Buzura suppressaria nucleopolyhedrovirus]
MLSTKNVVKFKQCVSVKLTPFKPIKKSKTTCQLHPLRANCRTINESNNARFDLFDRNMYHETDLNVVYLNYDHEPYYMALVTNTDTAVRGYYINADQIFAYINLTPVQDELFFGIDETGERQMRIITNTIKSMIDALNNCNDRIVLFVDELQIDLVYSIFRTFILPQRMVTIYFEENAPSIDNFKIMKVPDTAEAIASQAIYRTFVIYNTVFSMILKQRNPFNDPSKNISVIFRQLGKCPQNKERVKCCDLIYGGNAPGHVMCPPRQMIKRIFHYAKWVRTPNNYRRYYELIVKPIETQNNLFVDGKNDNNQRRNLDFILLDWHNFVSDFKQYFGI